VLPIFITTESRTTSEPLREPHQPLALYCPFKIRGIMPGLGDLPRELFEFILSLLDACEPPSSKFLHEQPSISMVNSDSHPLKDLSRTCHSMRCLTFTTLFKHARVHLTAGRLPESKAFARIGDMSRRKSVVFGIKSLDNALVAQSTHIDRLFFRVQDVADFLAFVELHNIAFNVESVLFYVLHPTPNTGFDWADDLLEPLLRKIIETINPEILTILAPPSVIADLARVGADMRDAWAFDIILRLSQPPESSGPAALAEDSEFDVRRPWSSCLYNEGSFLKVYSTYEYFSKQTPSLLALGCMCNCSLYGDQHLTPLLQLGRVRKSGLFQDSLTALAQDPWDRLQTFDFIVKFPLHSHVNNVLRGLYHCASIVTLRTQLASHSDSDMWKDPAIASIHADLWMEFQESYTIILGGVQKMGEEKFLRNFMILDCATSGKGVVDDLFRQCPLVGWHELVDGSWEKTVQHELE